MGDQDVQFCFCFWHAPASTPSLAARVCISTTVASKASNTLFISTGFCVSDDVARTSITSVAALRVAARLIATKFLSSALASISTYSSQKKNDSGEALRGVISARGYTQSPSRVTIARSI